MAGPYLGSDQALSFFQSVLSSAWDHATTSEVWAGIRSSALETASWILGVPSGITPVGPATQGLADELVQGVTIQDVNMMRAIAGQNVQAAKALAAASRETAISAEHIAVPPIVGTGAGTGLPPSYMVRVNYTGIAEDGTAVTDWYSVWLDELPETVGDLQDVVQGDAEGRVAAGAGTPPVASLSSVNQIILEQA
jgi:hypothetical protein